MPVKLNGQGPLVAAVVSGLIGGGSISAALPKMVPDWYRPNPWTEAMDRQRNDLLMKELKSAVQRLEDNDNRLDQKFEILVLTGPTLIRANQEKMLDLLVELHNDILKTGVQCERDFRQHEKGH